MAAGRMLLLAALVCVPVLVSASKWTECICNGGFCHCNWVFGMDFRGAICSVQKTRQSQCFTPLPTESSPDVLHQQGCSCSQQECVCQFGTDVEDSDICFHSSDGALCVPAKRSLKGDYSTQRSKWAECICNGAVCQCDWTSEMNIRGQICLHQKRRNLICHPVQQTNSLVNVYRERGCFCSQKRCTCNFGTVATDGEICVYSIDDSHLCIPMKSSSIENYGGMRRAHSGDSLPTEPSARMRETFGGSVDAGAHSGDSLPTEPSARARLSDSDLEMRRRLFKAVVLLELREEDTNKFVCSGTLITLQMVLTAAQCVRNNSRFNYWAVAGISDRKNNKPAPQSRRVFRQLPRIYPSGSNNCTDDVALFLLESPFVRDKFTSPSNMGLTPKENLIVLVSGWGTAKTPPGYILRATFALIVPRRQCLRYIPHMQRGAFCMNSSLFHEDSVGDIGSGVESIFNKYVLGVVSTRHKIGKDWLLVLMNVTFYSDWITETLV